jgi:hypothetical protein
MPVLIDYDIFIVWWQLFGRESGTDTEEQGQDHE